MSGKLVEERRSHFDMMLEERGRLITFELPRLPIAGERLLARRLVDHRMAYLDFEGPLSDSRGHVTRWSSGTWSSGLITQDKLVVDLKADRLSARLVLMPREELDPEDEVLPGDLVSPPWTEGEDWFLQREATLNWSLRASRWEVRNAFRKPTADV